MRKEYDMLVDGRLFRIKQGKGYKNVRISLRTIPPFYVVTAPYRASASTVEAFIVGQKSWLEAHVAGNYEADVTRGGSIFRYLGAVYQAVVKYGTRFNIEIDDGNAVITVPDGGDVGAYVKKYYSVELKAVVAPRLQYFEGVTGLKCNGFSIRAMSGRWGSCNLKTHKLTFNSYLMAKSSEFIDYVIIHELGHIEHANHGKAFKTYLDRYCPNWRTIKIV